MSIKLSIGFKQLNDSVFSDDLRELIGIRPIFEKIERAQTLPLLEERLRQLEASPPKRPTSLARNIELLGDLLDLDAPQREIMFFVANTNENPYLCDYVENIRMTSLKGVIRVLSVALGRRETELKRALKRDGNLLGTRIMKYEEHRNGGVPHLMLPPSLHSALFSNANDLDGLMRAFLENSPKAKLSGQAYPHLEDETRLLTTYLGNARKTQTRGVNILIYGSPGTGKTEFVRWFAASLGKMLYQVRSCDENGRPFSGMDRLGFYLISQRFLRSSDVLLLFDEIEDVFPASERGYEYQDDTRRAVPGKMFINQVLEMNPIPTFWVSNTVEHIDKAYLRRFDFSFAMETPPMSVRRSMLNKYLGKLQIDTETMTQLALREQLTPAQIEKAAKVIRVAQQPKRNVEMLLHVIDNSMTLLEQDRHDAQINFAESRYEIGHINADVDVKQLVTQLKQSIEAVGAICLYGAPGTGKTALAHYIAREIGAPIVAKRASDILSPYVGETEQHIAKIFRQAKSEQAILLLDEADSFLTERKSARNSWEITAVNEMLTQMESFKGLFICSTNLMQRLDEASLRRFALKIKFDYLRPEQSWRLFLAHVRKLRSTEHDELRSALDQLSNLTPGDFATVRRQTQLLNTKLTAREWLERLRKESKSKRDSGSRPIGFIQSH